MSLKCSRCRHWRPTRGMKTCRQCRERVREAKERLFAIYDDYFMCHCGRKIDEEGYAGCSKCRKRKREQTAESRRLKGRKNVGQRQPA